MNPKFSIVIPCFNEEEAIPIFYEEACKVIKIMKLDSYIIKFSSVLVELNPFEKKTITVSFLSPYPIKIENEENTIEILIKNGQKNSYINFNVQ